jgi:NADPH:quinone reductase-like Zn-dependent oxidoreductase
LIGYGSQTMAEGRESLAAAGLGLVRLWRLLSFAFGGRRGLFYSIKARRKSHPDEFLADITAVLELLRSGSIHPVVIDRLPLAAARAVHVRIDAGGLGGKITSRYSPGTASARTLRLWLAQRSRGSEASFS